jgi:opacity protein-like surface antigen
MIRMLTVAALLAATAVAVPATAAEFSGFRAEIQGGWDNPVANHDIYDASNNFQYTYHESHSGFMYGGEVGYDFPVSEKIIIGALANVGGTTVKLQPNLPTNFYSTNANVGVNWNIAARAGVKVADSTLLYTSLGYSNTEIHYYTTNSNNSALSFEDSHRYGGFLVAAGVEQAFAERFYGKLEYRYGDYQSGVSRNQIVAGVGMRF